MIKGGLTFFPLALVILAQSWELFVGLEHMNMAKVSFIKIAYANLTHDLKLKLFSATASKVKGGITVISHNQVLKSD